MSSSADGAPFRWLDGERLILFGDGKLADAPAELGSGYTLLTTSRAAGAAPMIADAAGAVHEVALGRVDDLAASLRPQMRGELLVALGGGRVIDVAKALAAADPPRRVAAIPTTLSGAEMTSVHRHARGVPQETPRVRPAIVINDPVLSASQPLQELAQSAANALGHAAEGPLTPLRNPVATLAALQAARLLAAAFAAPAIEEQGPEVRATLALGALLSGYVIGSTGYGLHHVVSQTLARFAGVGHGSANAIMLPHCIPALANRDPDAIRRLADALGEEPSSFAARLCEIGGATRLRDLGVSESDLDRCAEEASARGELHLTPPAAAREELRRLYDSAY